MDIISGAVVKRQLVKERVLGLSPATVHSFSKESVVMKYSALAENCLEIINEPYCQGQNKVIGNKLVLRVTH